MTTNLFTLLLCFYGLLANGQPDGNLLADTKSLGSPPALFPTPVKVNAGANPEEINCLRHHKPLPGSFSGYVIELTTSDLPLRRDYFLFEKFGNVFYEKKEKGPYSYCIVIPFSNPESVETYLLNIIKPKAPEARAFEYKNGFRLNKDL